MSKMRVLMAIFLAPLLSGSGQSQKTAGRELAWEKDKGSVALRSGADHVVWRFNYAVTQRKPCFHPVALPDSPSLSWLAPPDHPWHYGLWFSWKKLNGKVYWEFDQKTGRAEGVEKWSEPEITTREDFSARIEIPISYHPNGDTEPVLRERRVVEISAPAEDGTYFFDWELTFTACERAVVFERTPIPGQPGGVAWGGYAGLNFRFAHDFKEWKALNNEGLRDMKGHGAESPGCDFSGTIGGKEAGVAMLAHPRSRSPSPPWYLAMDKKTPMACLLAAPIFRAGFTLKAQDDFTLRYRVIVHPGRWDTDRIRDECMRYAKTGLRPVDRGQQDYRSSAGFHRSGKSLPQAPANAVALCPNAVNGAVPDTWTCKTSQIQ